MIEIVKPIAMDLIVSSYFISIALLAIDINMRGLDMKGLGGLSAPEVILEPLEAAISKITPLYHLR